MSDRSEVCGAQRSDFAFGEESGIPCKRVKIRDLESVFRADGILTHQPKLTRVDFPTNTNDNISKPTSYSMHRTATGLDLNAEHASTTINQDPFYPYKNLEHLKSRDTSECGSSSGPVDSEEKDPLEVWKEMKQNGFLSSSHGGIPIPVPVPKQRISVPKQRGRKRKSNVVKRKMEVAKREQVDRFAKIAAPSGLLNELNPGIINNVRNSKQVRSIIEALVKSEKIANAYGGSRTSKDVDGRNKYPDIANVSEAHSLHYSSLVDNDDEPIMEARNNGKFYCSLPCNYGSEDDVLKLKLSSSPGVTSDTTATCWWDESVNKYSISSQSVRAATIASQWLELLHQDIKGRLAALRRSKKRVHAVIQTELPFLVSKEFSSNQENDPHVLENLGAYSSFKLTADMHQAKWGALFGQMGKTLYEEEKQLESWLKQVKEMLLHCGWGLQEIVATYAAVEEINWRVLMNYINWKITKCRQRGKGFSCTGCRSFHLFNM